MAIGFGSVSVMAASVTGQAGTPGQITPTLPTSTAAGDLLIMNLSNGTTTALAAPAGWTLATSVVCGTARQHLMWKFAAGGESDPTFTGGSAANGMWGVLSRWTGVPQRADPFDIDPIGAASAWTGGANAGATMTTTINGAYAVWMWALNDNGTSSTAVGTGASVAYSGGSGSGYDSNFGVDCNMACAYKPMAAAGATGAVNMTQASGATCTCIRFALDPTPLPATGPTRLFRPF